jgi:hypothetical protein
MTGPRMRKLLVRRNADLLRVGGWVQMPTRSICAIITASSLALSASSITAKAQPTSEDAEANVLLTIEPIAALSFTGGNLLHLEIPPAGSTVPSNGVEFQVVGNATAVLLAEPDAFIQVPVEDFVGAAYLNGNPVGYKIELRFPRTGVVGSPIQIASLPGFENGPTVPPLGVNLALTGGERKGVIHIESSTDWTADGGMPLPGLYVGSVTLTLTASY